MRVGKAEQGGVDGAPQLTGEQGDGCNQHNHIKCHYKDLEQRSPKSENRQ